MFKIIILTCLIIQTHSWTWKDYPSPRGQNYSSCGISKPGYFCDPDGMLTSQQREEIAGLVVDFKQKTKRPTSIFPCMRDGLRLVVALAKVKVGYGFLGQGVIRTVCFKQKAVEPSGCVTHFGAE